MEWIKSTNLKYYDHWSAFDQLGDVYWGDNVKMSVGDTVYLYSSAPDSRITHKCIVVEVTEDWERASSINDEKYYVKKDSINFNRKRWFRLRVILNFYEEELKLENLLKNGLPCAPRSSQSINDQLSKYINTFLDKNFFTEEIEYQNENYFEGKKNSILRNVYERNSKAREICIRFYNSYNCQICEFDFEKVYGKIGKKFIHVHHIIPISEIGKEYKLIPEKDLIPVCPNCHAMLHRKYEDEALSVSKIKEIVNVSKESHS